MQPHRTGPTTPRLIHRAMTTADAEAFYALNSHPEVIRYTGEPPIESIARARDAIEHYPDFDTHGFGRWGCSLREDCAATGSPAGTLIGFCGLKYLDDLNEVDIGYRFFPEHWGRGYATEAGRASLAFGFDVLGPELGLDRIIALVLPENAGSIRVIEKLGMTYAGREDCGGLDALRYEITRDAHAERTRATEM